MLALNRVVLDARTATDHFPGIGRYVANLARALAEIAPPGPILLYDPTAPPDRLSSSALTRLPCAASPFGLAQQWRVPRALRRANAQLYHSTYYLMPYLPGVPTVLTVYDLIPLRYPRYFSAAQRLIFVAAHRLALRTARAVLTISEATRTDLVRAFGIAADKVTVTPLAVADHFRPQPAAIIDTLRRQLGLPDRYILYVGSNKPHKNLARLVEAFARARQLPTCASLYLVIAGRWDARYPEARIEAHRLGVAAHVVFLADVADDVLPALYSGAEVFVFPSEYEGFGLPVLEAMACGTPVICAGRSSLLEVASDAARLVDPHDVAGLAAAIGELASDPEERADLRARGLAQAARFSWRRTAEQTYAVYSAVA